MGKGRHPLRHRAVTPSGGQQQRVAIARVLAQRPSLLLADEPVSSLDPESAKQVMDVLQFINEGEGATVVCSLHQLDLAVAYAPVSSASTKAASSSTKRTDR